MTITSFLSKLGNAISSVAHTIGSGLSSGYNEIKSVISGTGHEIGSQLNNIINKGTDLAKTALKTGENLIQHTEDSIKSTITMPLILIAAGIGGLLLFNGKEVVQTAGQVATRMPPV